MILALKLKFILIILSIGAGYFLENHSGNHWIIVPDPVVSLNITAVNEGIAIKPERDRVVPLKSITPMNRPNTCTLGDLRIHIEL